MVCQVVVFDRIETGLGSMARKVVLFNLHESVFVTLELATELGKSPGSWSLA